MRFRRVGAQLLAVAPLASLVQPFPTADNLLTLAERVTASADGNVFDARSPSDLDRLRDIVFDVRVKRLLFDPLARPVDGTTSPIAGRQNHELTASRSSVSGSHAFRAPNLANGDQRGPCPALNALANHGYISHDGIVGVSFSCLRPTTYDLFRPPDTKLSPQFAEIITALNTGMSAEGICWAAMVDLVTCLTRLKYTEWVSTLAPYLP